MLAMVKSLENAVKVELKNCRELRTWLLNNHLQKQGVWLVTYKKPSEYYLPYSDIVEECIYFGWIDSLPRKLDEVRTMLYISPRNQGSNWSQVNKQYVAKLQQAGLLDEARLAKIRQARQDESWCFLDDVEALILPNDLQLALSANKTAQKNWLAFLPSSKRDILEWIKNAKKSETRARRIKETVDKAAKNMRANY